MSAVEENVSKLTSSKFDEFDIQDEEFLIGMQSELNRQKHSIELIASENFVSADVLRAQGSVLTNKYAEGYPDKRYYGGCEHVDVIEKLAIERACKLFSCKWANVQPHSGSQANQAVYLALLKPGDKILGMSLSSGGHLSHGAAPNQSGKWFNSILYGVHKENGLINYDEVERLALENKPKLIIAGASAYSRKIDFKKFREIADKVGAYFLADIAHYAGLIVASKYPSPLEYAHAVTTTTHKTLRGPRGGMILSNDENIGKLIDKALFPGLQGGPLMHVIAAKAVAFGEALRPSFKEYAEQIILNSKALANSLKNGGINIVSGGTDSHVILCDLRTLGITGRIAEKTLDNAGITCNKNAIPFDPESPFVTSGIRLGTPAVTTRGFKESEIKRVGNFILEVLEGAVRNEENNKEVEEKIKKEVKNLCVDFPLYSQLNYNS